MGLSAAALISSFQLPSSRRERTRIQIRSFPVLVLSLLPLTEAAKGHHIDYGAHIGGAVSCAIVALAVLKAWPATAPLPRFRRLAAGIAVAGLVLIIASAAAAAIPYPNYKIFALF